MAAAEAAGVSLRTARKWLRCYDEHGLGGLVDRSSRPRRTRATVDTALARSIDQMRRLRMPMRRIAELVGRSVSTISRWLARLGLSSLKALNPVRPVVRYEHTAPGEMLHIDIKKLGRIVRPSQRVTGDRQDSVRGAGWEFAHVAIDDHSRAASCRCIPMSARARPSSSSRPRSHTQHRKPASHDQRSNGPSVDATPRRRSFSISAGAGRRLQATPDRSDRRNSRSSPVGLSCSSFLFE